MTFTPFSQRNGYIVPILTAIKEDMPENVLNSVHNIFTEMWTVYNISPVIFDEMAGDFDDTTSIYELKIISTNELMHDIISIVKN